MLKLEGAGLASSGNSTRLASNLGIVHLPKLTLARNGLAVSLHQPGAGGGAHCLCNCRLGRASPSAEHHQIVATRYLIASFIMPSARAENRDLIKGARVSSSGLRTPPGPHFPGRS